MLVVSLFGALCHKVYAEWEGGLKDFLTWTVSGVADYTPSNLEPQDKGHRAQPLIHLRISNIYAACG